MEMLTARSNTNDMTQDNNYLQIRDDTSDDDSAPVQRTMKRVKRTFSESDNEKEYEQTNIKDPQEKVKNVQNNSSSSELESSPIHPKSGLITKTRIQMDSSSSESDHSKQYETVKNAEQQRRMKNKRNKMKDKFKGLLSSRGKHTLSSTNTDRRSLEDNHSDTSGPFDCETTSISKMKQKIKKSIASVSSICDPDTSDEEGTMNVHQKLKQRHWKEKKSVKLTEPKPIRMSAKQAMENMQLIKSESNRMLREKAVSLPYHRPKALSLKDIMSRRKPAVTSDGKALPIKMNEDQLKQYALSLEQRQKEMMELCKSESDEETSKAEEILQEPELPESKNADDDNNIIIEKLNNDCLEVETIDKNVDDAYNVDKDNELLQNDALKKAANCDTEKSAKEIESSNIDGICQEGNDKNSSNTDIKLVYDDSVEEENVLMDNTEAVLEESVNKNNNNNEDLNSREQEVSKVNSEPESQLISLHYMENNTEEIEKVEAVSSTENADNMNTGKEDGQDDFFSDDDVNMDDIDKIIENAEIMRDDEIIQSPMLIRDPESINVKPKLMGTPGMVIDLDGGEIGPKKLSGVEMLKQRFTYFAKLKTPEELEREREKKFKPGAQHLKLKHKLEEQIAEQRSLEWAKRLEEEKQQHMEMETILDDTEDSFEKHDAEIEETDEKEEQRSSDSEEEEELLENDIEYKDKPRKRNPMVEEEAEESDSDKNEEEIEPSENDSDEVVNDGNIESEDDKESSEDECSSESEVEKMSKPKKGRILKAFEDSDDENVDDNQDSKETVVQNNREANDIMDVVPTISSNEISGASQDDVIQLAQRHQSASDDLFMSQESSIVIGSIKDGDSANDEILATQTFSILESTTKYNMDIEFKSPSKVDALCMSQPFHDPNLNAIVEGSQLPITQSSQSQPIGEDILALCTGKFYDNEFVSQTNDTQCVSSQECLTRDLNDENLEKDVETPQVHIINQVGNDLELEKDNVNHVVSKETEVTNNESGDDGNLLKSILHELHDPEFDKPHVNKYFTGGNTQTKKVELPESSQMKKRLIIDSDDETNEKDIQAEQANKKKLKKKRSKKLALHISDDEEEDEELVQQEESDYISDVEEDGERLVEYDSEENEIEVKPNQPKKKRKVADFFEQEAELTSEDEWVGSGDEDEKDLDRMEREEGDDEVFHQGKLRRELGQIHMRDVLDQDKREVRLIQELLFEDGDLGDGHRQRKFRWRNTGDDDDIGTVAGEFADTQEEEFESEEQWRKQRHEREVFLRQMQEQDEKEGSPNVSVNRTTIIKANLSSKSMSMLLQEVNQSKTEKIESVVQEKKTVNDIPSPKKSFSIFQQNYHGSLLTRGRGALARLAALATPLASDDDAHKIGSLAPHKGNFVFAALTPDTDKPKVTMKRKAEVSLGTPKLVKKMKIEEKQIHTKSSLLDHFNL